ncbi:MAG: DNA-binding NtrC family response regulator, partial [Enterobacterales bacterium]
MPRILVIDDNEIVCTALEVLFSLNNIDVSIALSPEEGLEKLADGSIELVIQDMNFRDDTTSGEEGIKLFTDIRKLQPDMPIILLTAWGDLETAVELVRSGAADYMTKPWNDDKLSITVSNLLDLRETSVIY